jgi:hypothetical protein
VTCCVVSARLKLLVEARSPRYAGSKQGQSGKELGGMSLPTTRQEVGTEQADSGPQKPGFILLCGCPRSGTTLLAQHFGSALNIAMPDETHFIPHFRRYLWLWGNVSDPAHQRDLVGAMAAYSRIWIYRGSQARNPDRIAGISLYPVLARMKPVAGGFPRILDTAYRNYAEGFGMLFYGDKSASFEPENLALYDSSVDNLRVIHLIRDGRDVYRSWRAVWFGPRGVAEAAWAWRRHIKGRRLWAQSNKDRYFEIRYEDFLAEPQATLAGVAQFLGIPGPKSEAAKDVLGDVLSNEPTHTKLAQPVDPNNMCRWRDLPAKDLELFEFIAGDTLDACGYSVSRAEYRLGKRVSLHFRSRLGLLNGMFTANFYLRRVRELMPPIFRLMQVVGISVDAVARSIAVKSSLNK